VLLLSLLLMALRSHPAVPALGLLSSQNGVLLAACSTSDLGLPILLLAAIPLVPALAIAGERLTGGTHSPAASP
jgi:hypothetical protein